MCRSFLNYSRKTKNLAAILDFVLKRNVVRRIRSRTLFELNKYDITISKMYCLLTIKFIPGSTLDLLHYEWIDESASARKKEVCYSHMYIVIYLLLHDDKNIFIR